MTGHISNHAGTVAEVLRDEGYTTFAVGKWHLCQMADASPAGPFDQWPLQRGFDRFYGFLEGETDQYAPDLTYDNHRVHAPGTAADGYHLSEDLVDRALGFIHDARSVRPDRPFFCYLAFGATHAPHQAPPEYLAKYRGRFDEGWDVARERWFARQLELGLVPEGTELAPRNTGVEPWDELSDNQRALAARLQEAFAAFLDHTDVQIGRLVDSLRELGQLDNTLLFVLADNGASQEGGPFGVLHEMKFFNGILETPDEAIAHIDEIGGPHSHSNYPWGWAQAGNTPFKWYKQNTHEGGVHVPLIVHWPNGIAERGGIRRQFHHVNDIVPSIYDVVGVTPPSVYRGLDQLPVTGVSMRYTFEDSAASSRKSVQYFEMVGHRGIYADGWKAVTRHTAGVPFDDDIVGAVPRRRGLLGVPRPRRDDARQAGGDGGALVARGRGERRAPARRPAHRAVRRALPGPHAAPVQPAVHLLAADVAAARPGRCRARRARLGHDRDARHAGPTTRGCIYASGTENAGFSFFVQGGELVFDYNAFGDHQILVVGSRGSRRRQPRRRPGAPYRTAHRNRRAADRRGAVRRARPAAADDRDLERRPQRRLRQRLRGERPLREPVPVLRDAPPRRHRRGPGAASTTTPRTSPRPRSAPRRRASDRTSQPTRPAVDGRTARRDRNRDLVLDAVIDCSPKGQLAPNAADVAERSGVSLRSVYRYFEDQDALVRAAIARHAERVAPLHEVPDLGIGPFDERVRALRGVADPPLRSRGTDRARCSWCERRRTTTCADEMARAREALRVQTEAMFEPELAAMSAAERRAAAAALDTLLQFESAEHLRVRLGFTPAQTADVLRRTLTALLT